MVAKTRPCDVCVRRTSNVVSPATQSGTILAASKVHAWRTCIHTTSLCLQPLRCFPGSFSDVVCCPRPGPPALHIVSPRALPYVGLVDAPHPSSLPPTSPAPQSGHKTTRQKASHFLPTPLYHAPLVIPLLAMEQQLNLGHLLTAARLLDIGALDISSLDLGALTSSSSSPGSSSPTMFDITSEAELRNLLSGKLVKKHSSSSCSSGASTSSSHPYCSSPPTRKSSKHSRAAHNELEKTRRANLRGCLETLKVMVPCVSDATRNTTLALLTRARDHIIELQDAAAEKMRRLQDLNNEEEALAAELAQLQADDEVAQAMTQPCQTLLPPSRPESRASSFISSSSRDSPCYLEYSPSSKPIEHHKPTIIDLYAEGLIPIGPITFPRPAVIPHNFFDLFNLPPTPFDVSPYLPINLQV